MDVAISIVVTFLLTLANGYFSMSELAVVSAKRAVLEPEAEDGDRKARAALNLASNSEQFLATIQVAITLVGFASSAFASTSLSDPLESWFVSLGMPAGIAGPLAPVLITLAVSYLSIVAGELVPKRMALSNAEAVAKSVAGPIRGFMQVARPLVWLTAKSANGLSALLGIASADERDSVSEEEIKYMVTDADELSDQEKSMIHEVIDMGDTIAREVMVPRVDMTALEDTSTLTEVLSVMRRTGYSRIPIYHDSVDRIVGIAHIKDLISPILDEGRADDPVSAHVRSADFVPDTKDIIPLLSEMQSSHDQMVIVVDEYGGTAGVITIEDIVEEVVGEIEDEFDPDNKYLTKLSDREWLVDGRFSIDDAIELGWPIEDSEEYETVAGFVLELADKLPHPGDVIEKDGYQFRVQSMRGRRLSMLRVIAPEPPAEDENDNAGGEKDADSSKE
ncbi:hemolysin family protein [Thermophilibacter provencensis]|uniref:Hemolysin family protein n=1 Tax=Thermophilibacter provencensis TaxID=1852386 RepID=A0ABT7V4R2_9ACTN|nr:hemolysin family protein [Thermophilibacter provencensis]MDM8271594.1 hemolysin family protein [Thermophilibacter provencensis]